MPCLRLARGRAPVPRRRPDPARDTERRSAAEPPAVPVLLIRNHGLTTWGLDMEAAFNQVELAEYVFRYLVVARLLRL